MIPFSDLSEQFKALFMLQVKRVYDAIDGTMLETIPYDAQEKN